MKKTLVLMLIGGILFPQAAFAQYSTDTKANALIVSLMARIESLEKELAQFKKDDATQLKKLSPKEKKKLEKEEKRKKAKLEREAKKKRIEDNKRKGHFESLNSRLLEVSKQITTMELLGPKYLKSNSSSGSCRGDCLDEQNDKIYEAHMKLLAKLKTEKLDIEAELGK